MADGSFFGARILQNLTLAGAGVLLGLAVTESVTRLTAPVDLYALSHQVVRVSENPVLMYEGRPDWHEHNAQGFRSEVEYSIEKRPGVVRIAVIGDSTTYGYGVDAEHAFPRLLERKLGPGVEVWNFGVSGYSIIQELELLRTRVLQYRPDVVLLAVCLNDWTPYSEGYLHPMIEGGELGGLLLDYLRPTNTELRRLLFRSHAYRHLLLAVRRYRSGYPAVWTDGNPIFDHYAELGDWYPEHFRTFQAAVLDAGASFAVALLPMRDHGDAYLQRLEGMRTLCRAPGCTLIDVQAGVLDEEIYLPNDHAHFNELGNRLVAAAIARIFVDESGIL